MTASDGTVGLSVYLPTERAQEWWTSRAAARVRRFKLHQADSERVKSGRPGGVEQFTIHTHKLPSGIHTKFLG
jgi:hypothetical protein